MTLQRLFRINTPMSVCMDVFNIRVWVRVIGFPDTFSRPIRLRCVCAFVAYTTSLILTPITTEPGRLHILIRTGFPSEQPQSPEVLKVNKVKTMPSILLTYRYLRISQRLEHKPKGLFYRLDIFAYMCGVPNTILTSVVYQCRPTQINGIGRPTW